MAWPRPWSTRRPDWSGRERNARPASTSSGRAATVWMMPVVYSGTLPSRAAATRPGSALRPAAGPAGVLPGPLPGPRRSAHVERAGVGSLRDAAGDPAATSLRFSADTVGQGWGIDPACGGMRLFGACGGVAPDLFVNLRRHDLRRQPLLPEVTLDDGGTGATWSPGQVEGGRDARRVPRQLPLQPARRARAALQRRGRAGRAVGRPRDAQQLVPGAAPGRDARYAREAWRCSRRGPGRPSSSTTPLRSTAGDPGASTARVPYGPLVEVFAAGHAQLPRPEHRQPPADARTRDGASSGAAQLAWLEGARSRRARRPGR